MTEPFDLLADIASLKVEDTAGGYRQHNEAIDAVIALIELRRTEALNDGYYSRLIAEVEETTRKEERATFLEIARQTFQAAKDFYPDVWQAVRAAEVNYNHVKERCEG